MDRESSADGNFSSTSWTISNLSHGSFLLPCVLTCLPFSRVRNQIRGYILAMVLVHSIHNQSLPVVTFIQLGVVLHT